MAKNKQCTLCQNLSQHPLWATAKFGSLCIICYSRKHLELSRQGFEERLVRNSQRRLEAENQAFGDFIETGLVKPQSN